MPGSWSRRRFIAAATIPFVVAATGPIGGCGRDAASPPSLTALDNRAAAVLRRLCYLLFPYPEIGVAPYDAVVATIDGIVREQPARAALVREGIASLDDTAASGAWLDLDEQRQLDALVSIEPGEFFAFVLATTKAQLFNDPVVWTHIGYDPAAPPNDIDWLGDE